MNMVSEWCELHMSEVDPFFRKGYGATNERPV